MNGQPLIGQLERIDGVPLLIGMMGRMNVAEVLDRHLGRHHRHPGLSNGQLAVGWIGSIRSQADHRQSAVQGWAEGLGHTLEVRFGCPVRPQEFSDDRLGILLDRLAQVDWAAVEADLFTLASRFTNSPRGASASTRPPRAATMPAIPMASCSWATARTSDPICPNSSSWLRSPSLWLSRRRFHQGVLLGRKIMRPGGRPPGRSGSVDSRPGDPYSAPALGVSRGAL